MCAIRNTFKAYERLKREQHIETLFRTGKAFSVFPVKMLYLLLPRNADELSPVRAGFTVPKKKWRLSVKRHRIRRLMVESWRLHKHLLYPHIPEGQQLHIFLIYTDTTEQSQQNLHDAIVKGMERLVGLWHG